MPGSAPRASWSTAARSKWKSIALGRDYEKSPGFESPKRDRAVNRVALAVMAPSVLTYIGDHVAVFAGRQQCASRPGTALPADTHVLVTVAWTCPLDGGELRYRATPAVVYFCSAAILSAGLYWLMVRTVLP